MVGDWLSDDGYVFQVYAVGQNSVVFLDKFGERNVAHFDFIDGVKIKPEMLEKWGFKKSDSGQWIIELKRPIGCGGQTCSNTNPVVYAVWVDAFGMGCVSYLDNGEGNTTLDGGCYVHQLQHILNVHGIDKYIKIELELK